MTEGKNAITVSYAVKEIFYSLQGEGALIGRPAVFCRFAGCNLWSGREADRATAVCAFCDTDFVGTDGTDGGQSRDAASLADRVAALWPPGEQGAGELERRQARFVVCTGGEPLLQLDPPLIEALHKRGFAVAIETNGTIAPPQGLDWVCVSPKAGAPIVVTAEGGGPGPAERVLVTWSRFRGNDGSGGRRALQHRQRLFGRAAEGGLAARDDDRPLDDDRVFDHRRDQGLLGQRCRVDPGGGRFLFA